MLENIAEPHRPPYFAPFCARHANTHCPTGRAEALSDTYFYSTADMYFREISYTHTLTSGLHSQTIVLARIVQNTCRSTHRHAGRARSHTTPKTTKSACCALIGQFSIRFTVQARSISFSQSASSEPNYRYNTALNGLATRISLSL